MPGNERNVQMEADKERYKAELTEGCTKLIAYIYYCTNRTLPANVYGHFFTFSRQFSKRVNFVTTFTGG